MAEGVFEVFFGDAGVVLEGHGEAFVACEGGGELRVFGLPDDAGDEGASEVVEAGTGYSGLLEDAEPGAPEVAGVNGVARGGREDEALWVVQLFQDHAFPVGEEDFLGLFGEGEDAVGAGGLRGAEDGFSGAGVDGEGAPDVEEVFFEVDVGPEEAEDFSPAEAVGGEEVEGGVEAVGLEDLEDAPELFLGDLAAHFPLGEAGEDGAVHGVFVEATVAHGPFQGGVEEVADVGHGGAAVPFLGEGAEEASRRSGVRWSRRGEPMRSTMSRV